MAKCRASSSSPPAETTTPPCSTTIGGARCDEVVEAAYAAFLVHNETFKQLCTDWQLGAARPRRSSPPLTTVSTRR